MGKLKPIGSEKLTGDDKIKRILQIAKYNEVPVTNINETETKEYSLNLADGNRYEIVKEKQGYIIKRTISESATEYIEPMKNRKYYSSYSGALKRFNLLAAELNRLNENAEGVSLFGEEKKFVLKTPTPMNEPADVPTPPAEPPSVPSPELPPSPEGGGMPDMDELGMDDMGGSEEEPMGGNEPDVDAGPNDGEKVTFKTIQKLTGKLTQKVRELENEQGLTSENIKYVINMVLSSFDLQNLSDEDKEDILSKFEDYEEEGEFDDSEFGGEEPDMGMDTSDMEIEQPSKEMKEVDFAKGFVNSIFQESKVDNVLSKYFVYTKKEILESKQKNENKLIREHKTLNKKMDQVIRLSKTKSQEIASRKFLEENKDYDFIGVTNKNNLIFENKTNQIKITEKGIII